MTFHNWLSGLGARALGSCQSNFDGGVGARGGGVVIGGKQFLIVLIYFTWLEIESESIKNIYSSLYLFIDYST